jgi:hypothetical protein
MVAASGLLLFRVILLPPLLPCLKTKKRGFTKGKRIVLPLRLLLPMLLQIAFVVPATAFVLPAGVVAAR